MSSKRVPKELVEKHDEKPVNTFLSSTVRGHSNSIEENVARRVFEWIKSKADEGASFVVVGRCAEYVLKDFPGLISIFILGEQDAKAERTADLFQLSKPEAEQLNRRIDRKRKRYPTTISATSKWGTMARTYDMTINSKQIRN